MIDDFQNILTLPAGRPCQQVRRTAHQQTLVRYAVAIGFGGHAPMFVEERREVTLVGTANAQPNLNEGLLGLGQQPFRLFNPTHNHRLVC